jgi:hypothetical protein
MKNVKAVVPSKALVQQRPDVLIVDALLRHRHVNGAVERILRTTAGGPCHYHLITYDTKIYSLEIFNQKNNVAFISHSLPGNLRYLQWKSTLQKIALNDPPHNKRRIRGNPWYPLITNNLHV